MRTTPTKEERQLMLDNSDLRARLTDAQSQLAAAEQRATQAEQERNAAEEKQDDKIADLQKVCAEAAHMMVQRNTRIEELTKERNEHAETTANAGAALRDALSMLAARDADLAKADEEVVRLKVVAEAYYGAHQAVKLPPYDDAAPAPPPDPLSELVRETERLGLYEWQCQACKGTGKAPTPPTPATKTTGERIGLCEVCNQQLANFDLDDGVTIPAECCERAGLCQRCRVKGGHDCEVEPAPPPKAQP